MKNQCLYYALDMLEEHGGYIMFCKSTHWSMLHALHMNQKTGKITHYIPPADLKYPWYSMFGFEGYIKEYDDDVREPASTMVMFLGTVSLVVFGFIWRINRLFTRKNRRNFRDGSRRKAIRYPTDRRNK